jgi:hypothetical protein
LPSVNRLYTELKGRGLEVRLVSFQESPDTVRRVVRERGYVAPVLIDANGDTTNRWGVFGPPTAYLVDRHGRLAARVVGGRDWQRPAPRAAIEALLAGRPMP